MRKKGIGFYTLIIVLGSVIGSVVGDVINAVLPESVVKQFFLRHLVDFSFGPAELNLRVISLTLGFALNINIVGVLGIILIAYFLRWMD